MSEAACAPVASGSAAEVVVVPDGPATRSACRRSAPFHPDLPLTTTLAPGAKITSVVPAMISAPLAPSKRRLCFVTDLNFFLAASRSDAWVIGSGNSTGLFSVTLSHIVSCTRAAIARMKCQGSRVEL